MIRARGKRLWIGVLAVAALALVITAGAIALVRSGSSHDSDHWRYGPSMMNDGNHRPGATNDRDFGPGMMNGGN
ncbi:MAG: hypothetical protein WBQ14_06650 [Gaiellaceae bacterium]